MAEALKDIFFQEKFFDTLCEEMTALYPAFNQTAFLASIYTDDWAERALKDRMRHTSLMLHAQLPVDFRAALAVLKKLLPALEDFGFEKMIFPDYVELYGLGDWEAALPALALFTQSMSAEFAVRPFIIKDQDRMMAQMLVWADHEDTAVRRLASEGCRPRLPWAIALKALQKDPAPIFPILAKLIHDPEETVRRSVANNLNDIAKDHPDAVVDFLKSCQGQDSAEIAWIRNHALRSLLKAGHPGALALMGFGDINEVSFSDFCLSTKKVPWHGELKFSFKITSQAPQPIQLMIDYAVCFLRKNGKQSRKVFKLSKRTLLPGETIELERKFSFAPITTRTYYPGEQAIEIQINGQVVGRQSFVLFAV